MSSYVKVRNPTKNGLPTYRLEFKKRPSYVKVGDSKTNLYIYIYIYIYVSLNRLYSSVVKRQSCKLKVPRLFSAWIRFRADATFKLQWNWLTLAAEPPCRGAPGARSPRQVWVDTDCPPPCRSTRYCGIPQSRQSYQNRTFALYGRWEGLVVCKILLQGPSLISTAGKPNYEE